MIPKRRTIRLGASTAAITVAALALAACGSSSSSTASGSSQAAALTALAVGVPAVPPTLDPQDFTSGASAINSLIQYTASLVSYKSVAAGATSLGSIADITGQLADTYTVTPAGVEFTLKDAKSAAGNTLTSDDVKYTYERSIGVKDGIGAFLMKQAGIDLTNPVTVLSPTKVRINGTIQPLWSLAAIFYDFSILDSKVVKAHVTADDPWAKTWLAKNSATFGAYAVSDFQAGQRVTFTANPNYAGGAPKYSKLTMVQYGSQSAAQLLSSGSIQLGLWLPPAQTKAAKADTNLTVVSEPTLAQDVISLDTKYAPLADVNVRRAMSMAIDRASLVTGPYSGYGKPATTVVNSSIAAAAQAKGPYFGFDVTKAKALMAASGFPKGFDLALSINPATLTSSVDSAAVAVNLQAMLKEIGVNVTIDNVADASQFSAGQKARKYQAYLWSESPIAPDAAYAVSLYYLTNGLGNAIGISDPAADAFINTAVSTPSGDARDAAAVSAMKELNDKMLAIPLIDSAYQYAGVKSICGYAANPKQSIAVSTLAPCTS